MKYLFFTFILVTSSTSFAGYLPPCPSGQYDKWDHCIDESPIGQTSLHIGTASCLKTCTKSYEEMLANAKLNAQQLANKDISCGFKNIRSSEWSTPITSESTEGDRTWVQVEIQATFTCRI